MTLQDEIKQFQEENPQSKNRLAGELLQAIEKQRENKNDELVIRAFDPVWAELIVRGIKKIEVAKNSTKHNKILIYTTNKKYTKYEKRQLIRHISRMADQQNIPKKDAIEICNFIQNGYTNTGCIIGSIEIAKCEKNIGHWQFLETQSDHIATEEFYNGYLKTVFWILKNPNKFDLPIKITWPSGGPWAKVKVSDIL